MVAAIALFVFAKQAPAQAEQPTQISVSCRILRIATPVKLNAKRRAKIDGEPDSAIYIMPTRSLDEWVGKQLENGQNETLSSPVALTLSGMEARIGMHGGNRERNSLESYGFVPTLKGKAIDLKISLSQGESNTPRTIDGTYKIPSDSSLVVVRPNLHKFGETVVTTIKPAKFVEIH